MARADDTHNSRLPQPQIVSAGRAVSLDLAGCGTGPPLIPGPCHPIWTNITRSLGSCRTRPTEDNGLETCKKHDKLEDKFGGLILSALACSKRRFSI
ncbi:hypothetical protein RRG08_043931 [Elysia crispata]|uniref:Uncharacterized protein n=1 Tax=Elysia crispata TaxID=231223 RepID=A0AAE0Y0P3_9GAST|nr:hypothetical protein RRG08_043931 [Elysia crispata]